MITRFWTGGTGVYLDRSEVKDLAGAAGDAGSLLVVDEAYLSFVENPWDSLELLDRSSVMLVRSMTKDYAQTALRLGYALASEEVVSRLRAYQPDWSVNGLAQKAAISALEDTGYLPRAREAVLRAKKFLTGTRPSPTGVSTVMRRLHGLPPRANDTSTSSSPASATTGSIKTRNSSGMSRYILSLTLSF